MKSSSLYKVVRFTQLHKIANVSECGYGQAWDSSNSQCENCTEGFYSDGYTDEGVSCTACQTGTSTANPGSDSISDCGMYIYHS